jgi:hypothetical protein
MSDDTPASGAFDPAAYPRTYRIGDFRRAILICCAVALTAVGALLLLAESAASASVGLVGIVVITGIFAAPAALMILHLVGSRITLDADLISVGFLNRRRVQRKDIVGRWRNRPNCLILSGDPVGVFALPRHVRRDALFNAWLESLPQLDTPMYPRRYRMGVWWSVLLFMFTAVLLFAALVAATAAANNSGGARASLIVIGCVFLGSAGLLIFYVIQCRIVLERDRITVGVFKIRRVMRSDIVGRLKLNSDRLAIRGHAEKFFSLPSRVRRDAMFYAWIEALPQIDMPAFPRTYRPNILRHALAFFFAAWLLVAAAILFSMSTRTLGDAGVGYAVLACTALACAVLFVVYPIVARVILDDDSITIRTLYSRRLPRNDIAGRLKSRFEGRILVLRAESERPMVPLPTVRSDPVFDTWFKSLPEVSFPDELETSAAADPASGTAAEERFRRLKYAKRCSALGVVLTAGGACWAMIYPRPFFALIVTAILAPWPLVVVFLLSRLNRVHRFRIPAGLGLFFFLSGSALVVPYISRAGVPGIYLYGWVTAAVVTLAAAATLMVLLEPVDRTIRAGWPGLIALSVVGACAYAGGAVFALNVLLDRSAPIISTVDVVERHSRRNHWALQLGFSPWGDADDRIEVPPSFYNSVQTGETICVHLRPGAIGIQWFTLEKCH